MVCRGEEGSDEGENSIPLRGASYCIVVLSVLSTYSSLSGESLVTMLPLIRFTCFCIESRYFRFITSMSPNVLGVFAFSSSKGITVLISGSKWI